MLRVRIYKGFPHRKHLKWCLYTGGLWCPFYLISYLFFAHV